MKGQGNTSTKIGKSGRHPRHRGDRIRQERNHRKFDSGRGGPAYVRGNRNWRQMVSAEVN